MPPRILITRSLPPEAMSLARARAAVDLHPGPHSLPRADLIARLKDKAGLVCLITDTIDAEVLSGAPGLKVVANVAVGYNNIDVAAATARGIVVTNTPEVLTETTADFTWTLLMAVARRVVEGDGYVRAGKFGRWEWELLWGADVHGKTLGIFGFGRIGKAVARRARGFGMRILYHDTVRADAAAERELGATYVDKTTLLKESDFVTLHTLLSPETRHLIGATELRQMKRTAYLINASRGPCVNEAELVQALKEGWIAGAALDVYEEEPKVHPGLLSLPNVVLAPHIASASRETRLRMATLAVENCLAVLEGKTPPTPVNPEVLRK
ncbi:MAG: D-glycerate dehydrogenase [Candidatus Rokubacteria bacterium RIFCSPHIGHO2_02_FULL_69_13]|nr:MAG: D-glycerate dehydrogenase [Candidatus Rokubacteria bacterium RIFCSPHIGHO2_02_FULL_69_13]